jgi:RHS repeat-associated protein
MTGWFTAPRILAAGLACVCIIGPGTATSARAGDRSELRRDAGGRPVPAAVVARAALVCDESNPCPPPEVAIGPGGGPWAADSLPVHVDWYDEHVGLRETTLSITVTGQTPTFTLNRQHYLPSGQLKMAQSTGMIALPSNGSAVTVTAHICNMNPPASGANCTDLAETYRYQPPPEVRELVAEVSRPRGVPLLERFQVINAGVSAAMYFVGGVCDPPATVCQASVGQVAVGPGDTAVVGVNYRADGTGIIGTVGLWVADAGNGGEGYANTVLVAISGAAQAGAVGTREDLTLLERGMCVTAPAGTGAAYECGDLRLVHPLPTTRVLNKPRTPVLIYNSQHASPYPIVAAHVVRNSGQPRPDSLSAQLSINGAQVAAKRYTGFIADTVRIALGFDAAVGGAGARPTGVYAYQLEVFAHYPGQGPVSLYSRSGRLAIVNRMASPFGRGWWLAGLEQLVLVSATEQLWVGGDGSTRLYTQTSDPARWAGPPFDRPDTLLSDPSTGGFKRPLAGGDTVFFDLYGNHTRTRNHLGHVTTFTQTGGLLTRILLPAGNLSYTFSYTGGSPSAASGMLAEIVAPSTDGTANQARVVRLETVGTEVRRIFDPQYRVNVPAGSAYDYAKPHVQLTAAGGRVTARFDRTNVPTLFAYDNGGSLTRSAVALGPGDSIRVSYRSAEAQGLGGAVRDTAVYTLIDGPRPDADVIDRTRLYLDRWGAPVKVVNADNAATELRRASPRFPARVTSVRYANGREVSATYDDRGNLVSTTDWGTQDTDGRYATTTYAYDLRWDRVTRSTGPEGQTGVSAYDTRGRIATTQAGASSTRQVTFQYNPQAGSAPGMPSAVTLPAVGSQAAAAERYEYDALGNLNATVSPRGYRSLVVSDPIGRIREVKTPIDTTATPAYQVDSSYYDVNDRTTRSVNYGPAMNGRVAQRLVVESQFDGEGRALQVTRSAPDDGSLSITTTWKYDAAGRRTAEIAPDSTAGTLTDNPRDTTAFDAAGNPVWTLTRRGDTLRTRFDALNRPVASYHSATHYNAEYRGIPTYGGVSTCEDPASVAPYHSYPNYATDAACGYTVPADSAVFAYDPQTGALLRADNGDAKVSRSYYPNGRLRTDTLQIRASDSNDFSAHRYALTYGYDLAGRRRELQHPAQLAPSSSQPTRYAYDAETGALASVTDPLEHAFQYAYDARGQLTSLTLPNVALHTYGHDQDGQLSQYNLDLPQMGVRVGQTSYRYDARGKMLGSANATGAQDVFSASYSGLGHLVYDSNGSTATQAGNVVVETRSTSYWNDALANVTQTTSSTANTATNGSWMGGTNSSLSVKTGFDGYSTYTGRQVNASRPGGELERYVYDAAGNIIFQVNANTQAQSLSDLAQYYGGDGRLRAVDRRNHWGAGNYKTIWEEYRYDALGRRVWVRTRYGCNPLPSEGDPQCALNTVQRTVWDGDQALYEIRMPLADGENDGTPTVLVTTGNHSSAQLTGRALNTFGPGIDQPLSVIRLGYSGVATFTAFPLWDPTGRAPYVVFPSGSRSACVGSTCFETLWQFGARSYGVTSNALVIHHNNLDGVWLGTVMQDQRDASGLLYRRNRYYNPQTGRFTQEDPIGLAGGLNLYGFAGGNPVTYSDPFGLKVCYQGTASEIRGLRSATERATGASITLDANNCISVIGQSSDPRLRGLRDRLFFLAMQGDVYNLRTFYSQDPALGVPVCYNTQSHFCPQDLSTVIEVSGDVGRKYRSKFFGCWFGIGASVTETVPSILAHEFLGHAWANAAGRSTYDERISIGAENVFRRATGGVERCGG